MRGRVIIDSLGEVLFQVIFDFSLIIYFMYIFFYKSEIEIKIEFV